MSSSAALAPLFALLAGLGAVVAAYTRPHADPAPAAPAGARPPVKLAVLVVFDQMRGDYPERWRSLFGPGGFARLATEGAWFTRCYYPYGTTTTGPGHASILSGTCADRHGIVNNEWYEHGKGGVYCAADARYSLVPTPEVVISKTTGKPEKPPAGGTPERLLAETVADVLKRTYGPRAKVFGLSLKDRSAVLPTGRRPDGAFWFNGRFVTSTYYTDRLDRTVPAWVAQFNRSKTADRWFGRDWERFRTDLGDDGYARYSGSDGAPGEGGGKSGKLFPHSLTGGLKEPGKAYYDALANSPYGNELLLEFAKTCVRAEGLGRDDAPDLLVVSFSSNDLIGHTWGPDSQEVMDVTLRADRLMADWLSFLDREVGRENYVLAVTADHGICPLPEVSAARGRAAKRVDPVALQVGAEAHLRAAFGGGPVKSGAKAGSGWIESFAFPWLYLNPQLVAASGRPRAEVARSLVSYLAAQPDVRRAFTREDLGGEFPASDPIGRRVKRSYFPARCGDVYVVLDPLDLPSKPGSTGTTHGSPHDYDAFVPLMVSGPGVSGGTRAEPVTPQATAAIFAQFLGVRPPASADFPVPTTLEGK